MAATEPAETGAEDASAIVRRSTLSKWRLDSAKRRERAGIPFVNTRRQREVSPPRVDEAPAVVDDELQATEASAPEVPAVEEAPPSAVAPEPSTAPGKRRRHS